MNVAYFIIAHKMPSQLARMVRRLDGPGVSFSWSYGYGQGAYYAKHLRLRDRYTLRRFLYDVGHRIVRGLRFAR